MPVVVGIVAVIITSQSWLPLTFQNPSANKSALFTSILRQINAKQQQTDRPQNIRHLNDKTMCGGFTSHFLFGGKCKSSQQQLGSLAQIVNQIQTKEWRTFDVHYHIKCVAHNKMLISTQWKCPLSLRVHMHTEINMGNIEISCSVRATVVVIGVFAKQSIYCIECNLHSSKATHSHTNGTVHYRAMSRTDWPLGNGQPLNKTDRHNIDCRSQIIRGYIKRSFSSDEKIIDII